MPRTRELEKLKNKLRKYQFVALSGHAFSGKTWLCKELKKQLEEEVHGSKVIRDKFRGRKGMKWKIAYFELNHYSGPYRQLAKCLASPHSDILISEKEKVSPLFEDQVWKKLKNPDNRGLCDLYQESEYLQDYNLLIIVDQFENLFAGTKFRTEVRNEDQKNFIRLLLKASMEEQQIYLAVSIRPPKSERWKYQFKELWDAMQEAEFPIYKLDQEELEKAIWRSYSEESILFQERYHQQRQGTVPPNLRPFALDPEKQAAWAEQLYFHEDPLTAMETLVAETVISDWKNKGPKAISNPRTEHPDEEGDRDYEDSMVELDDEGYRSPGRVETSEFEEEVEITYGDEIANAEQLYGWLTPLEKRVTRKLMVEMVSAGGSMSLADAVRSVGRFESMVYQVAEKFVKEGVLAQSPSGQLAGNSEISFNEPGLEAVWERLAQWTGSAGVTPKVTKSKPVRETASAASPRKPQRETASSPAPVGSDMARKAEYTFGEMLPIQKRISEKIFVTLAANEGVLTLGTLIEQIGRFETLIPPVAAKYSQMGILVAEGHEEDPNTSLRIADPGLYRDWDRYGSWLSRQGVKPPAESNKPARETPAADSSSRPPVRDTPPAQKETKAKQPRTPVREAAPSTKTPRTPSRKGATASAGEGGKVEVAENHFSTLTPLEKRVVEKIFVTLSANGGSMQVGGLVDAIGRFEGIIRVQVLEWDKVEVLDAEGNSDENRVALSDLELAQNWKRFSEWLKRG